MPHRATYIFPRQFPERGLNESPKKILDHEKQTVVSTVKLSDTFGIENDVVAPKSSLYAKSSLVSRASKADDDVIFPQSAAAVTDLFNTVRGKHKQVEAFCESLLRDKKGNRHHHHHRPSHRLKLHRNRHDDDNGEALLPPPAPVKGSVDRQVSLPRLSSGSSYSGSLFTLDDGTATFSSDATKDDTTPSFAAAAADEARKHEQQKGEEKRENEGYALKHKESYHLQMAFAKRITFLATLASEPVLALDAGLETWDVESVSRRLWVTGCLSYTDKISDGFYNILGMNPYLWLMCNDVEEEGKCLPTLMALKAVEPSESLIEVVLIDRREDSRLQEIHDKAEELYSASENALVLVEQLGKLVAICMGGSFPVEQGDLQKQWKLVSQRLKNFHHCVVLPIGNVSAGICRHRAILFKRLADYIGLPCRIARGCRYCTTDHRSSILVKIKDDRQLSREYVVDLVGEPGNISGPDSSINGAYASSVPSPFQISHLRESQSPYVDGAASSQSISLNHSSVIPESRLYSGRVQGSQQANESDSLKINNGSIYASVDQTFRGVSEAFIPTYEASLHEYPRLGKDLVTEQETSNNKLIVKGNFAVKSNLNDSVLSSSRESEQEQVNNRLENHGVGNIPRYLNIEPSLAMDWLEISWDDLRIKERIGAGSFGTVYRAEWHGSDVAVKVLTVQNFHDDQLKEFLREVSIMKRVRHPNVVLFMGAVTKRPHLSIVTEYLPRGSLFRLIHRPASGEIMDPRRRLRMALDVAKGINYLHNLKPPIVHWDLKSPNLLVDKNWTVKVCDFGLSRFKANTFLSSKSVAGTPEWMAPEFLRGEPTNEKSDVFSYGVILWELVTLQQPWSGLSHAQVVGAVAFQNRRLAIPPNISPVLASLMESCWADDPADRPSFAKIVESLKKLLKSPADALKMGGT